MKAIQHVPASDFDTNSGSNISSATDLSAGQPQLDQFENEISGAARQFTRALLADGVDDTALSRLVTAVADLASGAISASLRAFPNRPGLACKAGCSYCCYRLANASAAEVLTILAHLRATRSALELDALQHRVAATDEVTHGLNGYGRLFAHTPCPLLADGNCSVYEVRPLVCRGYNSYHWVACAHDDRLSSEWKIIPHDTVRRGSYSAALDGLLAGLADMNLPNQQLELTAAMRIALETPDILERWRAGEDVFAEAREGLKKDEEMKASVGGRLYNTGQAEQIAEFEFGEPDKADRRTETLYRDRDGTFFLAGVGGNETFYAQLFQGNYIAGQGVIPLAASEARRWLEDQGFTGAIEQLIAELPAAAGGSVPSILLPQETWDRAQHAAERAAMQLDEWIGHLVTCELAEIETDERKHMRAPLNEGGPRSRAD